MCDFLDDFSVRLFYKIQMKLPMCFDSPFFQFIIIVLNYKLY